MRPTVGVSVVIPAYNVQGYITKTIQSLAMQDFRSFEVLVVNDGSSDKTRDAAVTALARTDLKWLIFDQANQGVSMARNRGLANATGEFVVFLDADDFVEPSFLSLLYQRAVTEQADVVFCGFDYVDTDGRQLVPYKWQFPRETVSGERALIMMLTRAIWLWTGSVMYRRHILRSGQIWYTEGAGPGEDQEFILKALFHARRVSCVPDTLSHYVQRPHPSSPMNVRLSVVDAYHRLLCHFVRMDASAAVLEALCGYAIPKILAGTARHVACSGMEEKEFITWINSKSVTDLLTSIARVRMNPVGCINRSLIYLLIRFPAVFYRLLVFLKSLERLGRSPVEG